MKANPPIKGHGLIREGYVWLDTLDKMQGGCACGAKPPMNGEYLPFRNTVKRWHRAHKAELRGEKR